jgi:pimeloyl-ACP methyl ester carboxylesterase
MRLCQGLGARLSEPEVTGKDALPMSRTRRLRRMLFRVAIVLAVVLVGALLLGVIYEQNARRTAATAFPPPGEMVDIGGRRIHLNCMGEGSPVVLLESGADTSGSPLWEPIQQPVAQFTRVCAYDRAGIMWSDPGPEPRDGEAIVTDLHAALTAAGVPGPYVMVGASMGGPYVMTFTREYPDDVAAVVFVDAAHPDQTARLVAAAPANDPAIPVLFRVLAALNWTGLPRLLLPAETIPELSPATSQAIAAYQPTSLVGAFSEAAAFEDSLREAGLQRDLGDRPLVVLSRHKPWNAFTEEERQRSGITEAQYDATEAAWADLQADEATWSMDSTHRVVDGSSHVIQLEYPDAVITAIQDVVTQIRGGEPDAPAS